MTEPAFRHPASHDLYTPMSVDLLNCVHQMRVEHGTWREVSSRSGVKLRVLRQIYRGNRKAVSLTLMDQLISATSVGSVDDFTWFTADDLVALGLWKPVEHFTKGHSPARMPREERRKRRKERKRRRIEQEDELPMPRWIDPSDDV